MPDKKAYILTIPGWAREIQVHAWKKPALPPIDTDTKGMIFPAPPDVRVRLNITEDFPDCGLIAVPETKSGKRDEEEDGAACLRLAETCFEKTSWDRLLIRLASGNEETLEWIKESLKITAEDIGRVTAADLARMAAGSLLKAAGELEGKP